MNYIAHCKSCNGVVAVGAKMCQQCGDKKPSRGQPAINESKTGLAVGLTFTCVVVALVILSYM